MNIIVKSFTEDAEGNVVAEVFLDNAAKIKLLEGALNNAMLDGVTGDIPVQDECGLFGDDIDEEEDDFYGQLGYFPEPEQNTNVITVVQEQIDALVIRELKDWYENSTDSWGSKHPEDIKKAAEIAAACKTLLEYCMMEDDYNTYIRKASFVK